MLFNILPAVRGAPRAASLPFFSATVARTSPACPMVAVHSAACAQCLGRESVRVRLPGLADEVSPRPNVRLKQKIDGHTPDMPSTLAVVFVSCIGLKRGSS